MAPGMRKFMLYGLPGLSVLFTFWLPASVQLSFLVTSMLSYMQLLIFKNPRFRERFNMYPISSPVIPTASPSTTATTATPSPYKGKMVRRGPPSQAELNSSYSRPSAARVEIEPAKSSNPLSTIIGGAVKEAKGLRDSALNSMNSANKDRQESRSKKAEKEEAEAYEKRRSKELAQEREERAEQRRLAAEERSRNKSKRGKKNM
jgi:YidC/Oxa1 family membrane protein insertase